MSTDFTYSPSFRTGSAIVCQALREVRDLMTVAPYAIVTGNDDAPLECPVCGSRDPDKWFQWDWCDRLNDAEATPSTAAYFDNIPILTVYQTESDFATIATGCTACDAFVKMPKGVQVIF